MKGKHFICGSFDKLGAEDMGLCFGEFERRTLRGEAAFESVDRETALVILDGEVAYCHAGCSGIAVHRDMLYLPLQDRIDLRGNATVLRYSAPCSRQTRFEHIPFAEVDADSRHKTYGDTAQGSFRHVWNCIDDTFDSVRLLMGFCDGVPGGWTAWPPHEHGSAREEIYYYTGMGDGFALQCVYESLDEAEAVRIVREGDLISVPGGYHPNVGCPKTGIHYLFCMVSVREDDRRFMDLTIQSQFGSKLE